MAQNRFYSSVAAKTTLTGTINASATTLTVASATGFPASLPYTLILERDTANEEVVTVTAVSTLTLTVTRAQDGTTGVSHTTGAVVEHGVSARDFNEPQAHIAASSAVHGITGSVVGTTDAQTLTNKTLTGAVLDAASTVGGVSGTSLAADRAAWTAYTPTLTNITLGNGTVSAAYLVVGKTVHVRFQLSFGSTTTIAPIASFTVPFTAVVGEDQSLAGSSHTNIDIAVVSGRVTNGSTTCQLVAATTAVSATVPFAWVSGNAIAITGAYEAA